MESVKGTFGSLTVSREDRMVRFTDTRWSGGRPARRQTKAPHKKSRLAPMVPWAKMQGSLRKVTMLIQILGSLFLPLALLAQVPPAPPAPPAKASEAPALTVDPARLEVIPPGRIRVGSVGPTEKKTLAYTFRNISAAPISLRVGDLSPGVTVQGPALEKPIGAKESAALSMTIDPTDFVGVQRRNVRILTDDPKQGRYMLPVEIVVRPDLTVDQERKSFGDIASHESPQVSFTFLRETDTPLQLRLVSPLPDYLEQEWSSEAKRAELRLTFRPTSVAPGTKLGLETLVVESNAPHQPRFTLYLDWKLRRPVEAAPSRLVFLNPTDKVLGFSLKGRDGQPFTLLDAVIEGQGFTLEPLPKGPATEHKLRVLRSVDTEAKAMLVLRFEGQEETLKVPLAYLPASPTKAAK